MIVDIHGHYYESGLYPDWVPHGLRALEDWMENQDIKAIVASSLDVFSKGMTENENLSTLCKSHPKLWQWWVVDPRKPKWWINIPHDRKILGIKVHPTWQRYNLINYLEDLLKVASSNKWGILTHSSVSDPYVNIKKSIQLADKYPEVPFIFAHLGHEFSGYHDVMNQVEFLAKSKNENTFIDTSSLAIHLNGLLEEAVRRIGSHRILFGSDMPLHLPQSQECRIVMANLKNEDKEKILWKTAVRLWPQLGSER